MKLKCNACEESPIVKIPLASYQNQELYCPSCGLLLARVPVTGSKRLTWEIRRLENKTVEVIK